MSADQSRSTTGPFQILDAESLQRQRPNLIRALTRWGRRNARVYPWREDIPLWLALIAEVMLQRTRADQVVSTFNRFRYRYPSPEALALASEAELSVLMEPLGLRWRARLLYQLAQEIGRLGGTLPLEQSSLERLPGVGPYAAAATLTLHANRRAVLIDSNVVRVLSRLTGATHDGETRRKRWLRELAEALTPPRAHRTYNYAVLDLAALVCLSGTPKCYECPILKWCLTGKGREGRDG